MGRRSVTPTPSLVDQQVRLAMFEHLDRLVAASPEGTVTWADANTFQFRGRAMPLMAQTGIWKPAILDAALTIRTAFTPPDREPPYLDSFGDDGYLRYKYRGHDPNHADNRALRVAMTSGAELVYFVAVARGVYLPRWPVSIVAEDPAAEEFSVAVDTGLLQLAYLGGGGAQRAYALRVARERLHQPVFRARVLRAYQSTCAMCRLRHANLLDAAHILPDGHPLGTPIVPNGLALCKIHHAAFDTNLLGIRPDLVIEVQPRILREIDGPMLRHGLQEMHGSTLLTPRARASQPDRHRLDERYRDFRQAS